MNAITWTDRTNYRNAPSHREASVWDVTVSAKTYRVERAPAAYHVWDGLAWVGMYATRADVETAITPASEEQAETAEETFEGVDPGNVHVGDRLQFMTRDTGFNGRGLHSRTGVVVKVTAKAVRVVCGNPASYRPDTAVLRRDVVEWHSRAVRRVVTGQPARRPFNAENVQYVDEGNFVTAVWCSDPSIDPKTALDNILRSFAEEVPYEVVQIAEATRHFKREGASFSGWIISRGNDYSTEPIQRKPDAIEQLRGWVEGYFER